MLKEIPSILSPDLLKTLMEMGHGDELVLGDGNFPSASFGKRLVRCDGHGVPELLDAILRFFPLDTYVERPIAMMEASPDGKAPRPAIWDVYAQIIKKHGGAAVEHMERFAFYDRAKAAYAIVATGESAVYANVILKKGVVVTA